MKKNNALGIVIDTVKRKWFLSLGVLASLAASIVISLLPPLLLEAVINALADGGDIDIGLAFLYFAAVAGDGIFESVREGLLTVFGQKITHAMRKSLEHKLTAMSAAELTSADPGAVVSRFTGDVDTVESLFTSGVISMFADVCRVISIMAIILSRSTGLAVILLAIIPPVFFITRTVQKRMLSSQLANRAAVARVSGHVPETIHCLRTIRMLGKEEYMKKRYGEYIDKSYAAIEKTNFYDAIYSPIILIFNAVTVAVVMLMSASGNPIVLKFFGMSVGTAVAVINYISQIFTPIESIGMEIQTVQSAVAGVKRINDFLALPEREIYASDSSKAQPGNPSVELHNVTFGYDEKNVLNDLSFTVNEGEQVTLAGRTGAGKSTVFKLILGLYKPCSGHVTIGGKDAYTVADSERRKIYGCVEQSFHMVPGSIRDQITLFDREITDADVVRAAKLVGLDDTIRSFEHGYDTPCTPSMLSQGQWQLLSIARAVAADPRILLLDEITANLDAETEEKVLDALKRASASRTVLSISHRLFEHTGGRIINIAP